MSIVQPVWVIPYVDLPATFWQDVAARYPGLVREVYFPIPREITASGRGRQPDRHLDEFLEWPDLNKAVLVNPVVLDHPLEELAAPILVYLRHLNETYGVTSVTVTHPGLASSIRKALPQLHITASTLMSISSPAQLLAVAGLIDTIVPDNRLIRDLAALKRLRAAFHGEIRLIVNEGCIPGCLYRTQHFYEMGYCDGHPKSLCAPLLAEHPWLRLTGAWLLPRQLKYYQGLYDTLKIAGRSTLREPQRYFEVLDAYLLNQEILPDRIGGGPASVLEPLPVGDDWFEYVLQCDKNCNTCTVCPDYYKIMQFRLEARRSGMIAPAQTA
jgi:hypothetical protein